MANNYKTTRHQDLKASRPQVMWSCGLILFFLVVSLFICTVPASATSVPQLINYQGKLTDRSGVPREGIVEMTFSIWSHKDSINDVLYLKWQETHSTVYVRRGIFSVLMGSVDMIGNPISPEVFGENKDLWLGITVDTDSEMRPRSRITSMGYAFNADRVQGQGSGDNIFPSSGDVGIGTTGPATKLDVRGELSVQYGTYPIRLYNEDRNDWAYISNPVAAGETGAKLTLADAAGPVIHLDGTGNVGIGTTSPGAALDIIGNVRLSDTHLIYNSQAGVINWGNSGGGNLYFRTLSTQGDESTYADKMIILNNGDVGIGTTSPSERLDLGGGNIKMGYERVWAQEVNYLACPSGKGLISGGCNCNGRGGISSASIATSPSFDPPEYYGCSCNTSPYIPNNIQIICANIR